MIKWEAFVQPLDGQFVVMIRNHNNSYGLMKMMSKPNAEEHARRVNAYPIERKVSLYRSAMQRDILHLTHQIDFSSDALKRVTIDKGEGQYELRVWIEGHQYIIKKMKYKKDIAAWYKGILQEYTEDEFIAKCKTIVDRRQSV